MKFAKYLESESIPEWRRAYINYKGLKKRLKNVEKFRRANERQAAIELDRAFHGSAAEDSGDEQYRKPVDHTNTNSSNFSGQIWRWPWNANVSAAGPAGAAVAGGSGGGGVTLDRQLSFPHSLIRKVSSPFKGDNTELTRVPSRPVSIQSSATLSVLEEVLLHASDPERAFFHALNIELDKVALFYDEKEEEARTKLEALKIQMQLIAEYGSRIHDVQIRDEANHQDDSEAQQAYRAPPHGIMGWFHRRRKTTAEDDILPEFHTPHLASTGDYSVDRHVSYNVARSRLKKALTEFHRSLEFLRSYKTLNETGFHKIMKKFDKTAGWKASTLYLQRLEKYHWITSDELNDVLREAETLFINEFADGHRRRGMRKLRVPEKHEDYNSTTLRIGLYLGVALPLLIHAVQLGFDPKTSRQLPNTHMNLQIYACFLLPVLFCLGFAVNLIIWHRNRISYKFIFELDPRHNLDYHQFGELPAFLLLVTSFIMYMDFAQLFASLPSELCPLILLIILVSIMFCPFDILYCSARRWLGVALGRIFLSYCFRVEFRDFFIADELNSLAYSFWTLTFFFCSYAWHWSDLDDHCNASQMWVTPFIASLPPWWRLLQCLRRYRDSTEKVHLYNAAKYLSSILATLITAIRRMYPGFVVVNVIYVLLCIANSTYTSIWDIKMDWGLLHPYSRNFLLRDDLVFQKWMYYTASVVDVILRFAWLTTFAQLRVNSQLLTFIMALAEAFRRLQWNVFRLENEHLNNCGQYRAIKEIPLPFALNETVKTMNSVEEGSIHLPPQTHPIPIDTTSFTTANFDNSWMNPVTRQQSTRQSQTACDSVYSGSFYGRRDFENRHDEAATKEASGINGVGPNGSAIENVLTRIRSFGNGRNEDLSDGSDTEPEEDFNDAEEGPPIDQHYHPM